MQARYHIDFDSKIYPQLLQICAIVSSLDISIIVWILSKIENLWLMMIIGFVSMLLFIVISYHFVYYFYKKKGMVKDGKHK